MYPHIRLLNSYGKGGDRDGPVHSERGGSRKDGEDERKEGHLGGKRGELNGWHGKDKETIRN